MEESSENGEHEVLLESPPELAGSADWPADAGEMTRAYLQRLVRDENLAGRWQLSLTLTDDDTIRAINREWREKDYATDVLSFPQFEFYNGRLQEDGPVFSENERILLGDIVISFETCRRQGREVGHGTLLEFQRLVVHGLLHLVGYDHERSAEEEQIMQKREDQLLDS